MHKRWSLITVVAELDLSFFSSSSIMPKTWWFACIRDTNAVELFVDEASKGEFGTSLPILIKETRMLILVKQLNWRIDQSNINVFCMLRNTR